MLLSGQVRSGQGGRWGRKRSALLGRFLPGQTRHRRTAKIAVCPSAHARLLCGLGTTLKSRRLVGRTPDETSAEHDSTLFPSCAGTRGGINS